METLIIDVPERKSVLVKQLLESLGIAIRSADHSNLGSYKRDLANVSVWSDDDLKVFEETKKAFEDLKPQQW
jgi:hypothetical protein